MLYQIQGSHFKLPFVQNVVRLDKRILAYNGGQEEIIASDQKRLVVDTYTRFKIVDPPSSINLLEVNK